MNDLWLVQRKDSPNFFYRRTVPADVIAILRSHGHQPREEVWKSTGTSERRQARLVMQRMNIEQDDQWEAIRRSAREKLAGKTPTRADINRACRKVFDERRKAFEARFAEAVVADDRNTLPLQLTGIQYDSLKLKDAASKGVMLGPIVNRMDGIIEHEGWVLPKLLANGQYTEGYWAFYHSMVDAVRDAADLEMRSAKGEAAPAPTSEVIRSSFATSSKGTGGEDTTLAVLAQKFEEGERRSAFKDGYTIDQQSQAIRLLVQHCEPNILVESITKRQMAAFVEVLLELPVKFSSRSACKGISLAAAVAVGIKLKLPTRSPKTVYRELSGVSSFFKWLVQRQYVEHNLTSGLFPRIEKRRGKRPPFSDEQLNLILASPLFKGSETELKPHLAGDVLIRDWRFWIPMCSMFTGARATELAQLLVSDIHQNGDRWAFHIEECDDEDTAKALKNAASRRVVPMHRTLEAAGFLKYVNDRREAKDLRLFPGLKPVKGRLGAKPSRAWRDYLTRIGMKHGADGLGLHSFRHTITDQLRLAGFYDDQIAVVLGHSKDLMTTRYGKMAEGTFQQRCEIIDSVAFTGVDISTILPATGH